MYYFKSDMSGLYLILKVPYERDTKKKHGKYYASYLRNRSKYIRDFLKENSKLDEDLVSSIDLGDNRVKSKLHNSATIVAKYYDKDNIPSTEDLVLDIKRFADLRKFILKNYIDKTEISVDEWVFALENKSVIDDKMFSLLEIMYDLDDYKATTGQLIQIRKKLGFDSEKSYNSTIVANSNRVKKFLNKESFYNKDGTENYWMRFFYGSEVRVTKKGKRGKAFQFKLKNELITALGIANRNDEIVTDVLENVSDNDFDDEIIENEWVDDMVEEKLFNSFYDYLLYKGYFFDKETIENYLLSLKAKPFAILTGNSGTGKTKLSQLFAQYLIENYSLEPENKSSSINTEVLVGKSSESGGWALNRNDLKGLIPIDELENSYSIIVDGVPANGNLKLNPRLFFKGNELKQHLAELAKEDERQKVPLEIILEDEVVTSSEYIDAKITLNKDGSAAVTKYLNNILPLNDYQGRFDGFIDDVPVKLGFNVVAYLRFGKKFVADNITPKYAEDDEINIKINVNDIKDFVSKPEFSGFSEMNFTIGSFPEHRIKVMSKEDHIKFFNIKDKLKDCEVIVDGESTSAKFYLSDTIICLKSEEANNYIEELSKRDRKDNFSIKIDLDSFKPHYPNGKEGHEDIGGGIESLDTNYKIIPVGANWTENRHIVGYYNVITNEYQSTPAYDLIKAANNSTEPHFLILDEMNLSHVERYFADFLSAIESGEKIPLYGEEELTLPNNLFIIGTVNVDETTYMFSPKVLDRANVIEFETYSASDYMNNKINLTAPKGNVEFLEDPLAGNFIRDYGIDELRELFVDVTVNEKPFWNILTAEIFKFQEILKESGFDFGFRVINEIVRFMAVAWEYENKPDEFTEWARYFDACIKQKLLPKLHGSEKIIGETLDKLYAKCLDSTIDSEDMAKYPQSYKKLGEMREVLRKQRYVSFIN